jgi:hypothetical protein
MKAYIKQPNTANVKSIAIEMRTALLIAIPALSPVLRFVYGKAISRQ